MDKEQQQQALHFRSHGAGADGTSNMQADFELPSWSREDKPDRRGVWALALLALFCGVLWAALHAPFSAEASLFGAKQRRTFELLFLDVVSWESVDVL